MNKKKTLAASANLIESLMDDLKDLSLESSYSDIESSEFSTAMDESALASQASPMWDSLEQDVVGASSSSSSDYELPDASEDSPFQSPSGLNLNAIPEDSVYKGPSADAGYQSIEALMQQPPSNVIEVDSRSAFKNKYDSDKTSSVIDESTRPVATGGEDKTVSIQYEGSVSQAAADGDKTIAVEGFVQARTNRKKTSVDVQVSVGDFRGGVGKNVLTSVDASLAQSENLKIAQRRILDLEKEVESLRSENEELSSAGEIIRMRTDELESKVLHVEKEKVEIYESAQSEILLLKGSLQHRETELAKSKIKIDELESRLKSDFKKIRVHERELENRLELLRAEKSALVRSKDEYILEQKRKIDQLSQELDNYRKKCLELNRTLESNQDQFKRTERALRLALTNLEVSEDGVVPLKKAE